MSDIEIIDLCGSSSENEEEIKYEEGDIVIFGDSGDESEPPKKKKRRTDDVVKSPQKKMFYRGTKSGEWKDANEIRISFKFFRIAFATVFEVGPPKSARKPYDRLCVEKDGGDDACLKFRNPRETKNQFLKVKLSDLEMCAISKSSEVMCITMKKAAMKKYAVRFATAFRMTNPYLRFDDSRIYILLKLRSMEINYVVSNKLYVNKDKEKSNVYHLIPSRLSWIDVFDDIPDDDIQIISSLTPPRVKSKKNSRKRLGTPSKQVGHEGILALSLSFIYIYTLTQQQQQQQAQKILMGQQSLLDYSIFNRQNTRFLEIKKLLLYIRISIVRFQISYLERNDLLVRSSRSTH
jgi:hypothetical protein